MESKIQDRSNKHGTKHSKGYFIYGFPHNQPYQQKLFFGIQVLFKGGEAIPSNQIWFLRLVAIKCGFINYTRSITPFLWAQTVIVVINGLVMVIRSNRHSTTFAS